MYIYIYIQRYVCIYSAPILIVLRGSTWYDWDATMRREGTSTLATTALPRTTWRQILSQSPTDATRFWWHLYGS